ncbi:hypothetical protein ACHAW5_000141 [Stephanodiscus triporus]|uniref:GPI inositol-deacylase n=1 Tax=Stephanodiscus triporus TaxID=2934178 RepID=A0ABD3MLV3_9STRA
MTSRTCDTWDTSRPRLSRHASARRRRRGTATATAAAAPARTTTTAPSVGGGGRGSEAGADAAAAFATFHLPSRRRSLAPPPGSSSLGSSTASSSTTTATILDGDLLSRGGGGAEEAGEGKGLDRRCFPPRPVPNVGEPNLFDIPPDLHPTYRQIPALFRVVLASVSALLVAGRRRRRRRPSSMFGAARLLSTTAATTTTTITAWRALRESVVFLLRAALLWKISELVVQERFLSPSRVTTAYLAEGGRLPSALSRYGSENSAGIGLALLAGCLDRRSRDDDGDGDGGLGAVRSVAVFGHSMGARAALSMALRCASDPGLMIRPVLVVLVAPALEGVTLPQSRRRRAARSCVARSGGTRWGDRTRGLAKRVWVAWRRIFVDRPLRYGLRRLVW